MLTYYPSLPCPSWETSHPSLPSPRKALSTIQPCLHVNCQTLKNCIYNQFLFGSVCEVVSTSHLHSCGKSTRLEQPSEEYADLYDPAETIKMALTGTHVPSWRPLPAELSPPAFFLPSSTSPLASSTLTLLHSHKTT